MAADLKPSGKPPSEDDGFVYKTVPELETLSLEELEKLWDMVPTEDRDYLQRRYRRKLKAQGVGDDIGEIKLVEGYLNRYVYEGLVPAGDGWLRLSATRRQQYASADDDYGTAKTDEATGMSRSMLMVMVFVGCLLIVFLISRVFVGGGQNEEVMLLVTETLTPTATLTLTPTLEPTITPTPTATPIALMESDRFVKEGERSNSDFYPVVFTVAQDAEDIQPRVFVVQERMIDTSEWKFEANPDVLSWVSGTVVRPVLGVPYSAENKTLLSELGPGSQFVLRMNTGGELRFEYTATSHVGRQDTTLFGQFAPGIELVLIGETDETGLPTSDRLVVSGAYNPYQEVDLTSTIGLPMQMHTSVSIENLTVSVEAIYTRPVPSTDTSNYVYAVVDVSLRGVGDDPVSLSTYVYQWLLEVNDVRYSADPTFTQAHFPSLPDQVAAGERVFVSLAFLVPRFTGDAYLLVATPENDDQRFILPYTLDAQPITVEGLDVQLKQITHDTRNVYVDVRLYNPQSEEVIFDVSDTQIIYGFVPNPGGPHHNPEDFTTLTIAPDAAYDVRLRFAWNGDDPFGQITLAGRVYAIQIVE